MVNVGMNNIYSRFLRNSSFYSLIALHIFFDRHYSARHAETSHMFNENITFQAKVLGSSDGIINL